MQNILKTYLKRLINLSASNRSLLLLNPYKTQFLDFYQLNFLQKKVCFDLLEQVILKKKTIPICDILDSRFEQSNEISKQLGQILRASKIIEEESGTLSLFVGYPFVEGKFMDGSLARCPLLFFPVNLIKDQKNWILESRQDEIQFNYSFLTAFMHFNKVKLNDDFADFGFNGFAENSLDFRTKLYELLKENNVEINFNSDLFKNEMKAFDKITKNDFDAVQKLGEMKLISKAVFGIFPQGGSYLIEDYERLEQKGDFSMEELFLPTSEQTYTIKEEHILLPFTVDASQEEAILQIKQGKSMVIQGPPGTGKSQLICNVLSDFVAKGKRVLVVCQKRAALDTVYDRLSKINLSNFVGLVHDFKADRKSILEKLALQIGQVENYQNKNKSLDTLFIEREFDITSRKIEVISRELDEFKKALFNETICQKSIKELYLLKDNAIQTLDLEEKYLQFKFNEIDEFLGRIKQLEAYQAVLRRNLEGFEFWKSRNYTKKWSNSQKLELLKDLELAKDLNIQDFEIDFGLKLEKAKKIDVDRFIGALNKVKSIPVFDYLKALVNKKISSFGNSGSVQDDLIELQALGTIKLAVFYLNKEQIECVQKANFSSKSLFSKLNFQLFSGKYGLVKEILKNNNLSFAEIENLNSDVCKTEILKAQINKYSFLNLENDLNKSMEALEAFLNAVQIFEELQDILPNFTFFKNCNTRTQLNQKSFKFDNEIKRFQSLNFRLNSYFSEKQHSNFWQSNIHSIIHFLEENFEIMQEFDTISNELNHQETSIFITLQFNNNIDEVFFQSLIAHWINHIEDLFPILKSVSTLKIENLEKELTLLVAKKQEFSVEILLIKLREWIYKDLELNRLGNTITYRDLLHQSTKKRGIWPLRKFIQNFWDEIVKIMPCWLVSPETASALFQISDDNSKLFDLVIFDESSQCFPEQGIPSIAKAKQVIIVGDKQQLQPNDLYKVRFEEETEDETLLEVDSLMQLACQFLPQKMLKGHYRSRSLELIAFSNLHFYENDLRLLPHKKDIELKAINWLKVDGLWKDQTNQVEVLEIINLVKSLDKSKEIGVVAFNFKQADLIFRSLELEGLMNEKIHVKNIENIQGDEYDIVIFSIGYAPDLNGKLKMNFGLLNQRGGENRLNVAITRAREQIFVISSIEARQLEVGDSQNIGPKLLKKYLEFVESLYYNSFQFDVSPHTLSRSLQLKNSLKVNPDLDLSYLPYIDLINKNTNEVILTDDQLLFQSLSAKEYFVYTPNLLKEKGWTYKRAWSRNWKKI